MRLLSLEITEELSGRTVKNLLKRELSLSASLISHLKYRENGICLNGLQVRTTEKVSAGDLLSVNIADGTADAGDPSLLDGRIFFEDDDLIIFDKPAGTEMHPADDTASVRTMVCGYLGNGSVFHPVNRLDAGTSGLMAAAKNRYMCDRLRRLLHTDSFRREYLAVSCGIPQEPRGIIRLPIDGLDAQTEYTVLCTSDAHALVRLRLHTGRTHQIRRHMSMIGCPLYGDARYGSPAEDLSRPALHSASIFLVHPLSGKTVTAACPPPKDLLAVIDKLFGASAPLNFLSLL